MHSEAVEKKEQEFGYYPHINRCAVCGYPASSRKGIILVVGVLACAALVVVITAIGLQSMLSVFWAILCVFGMAFFVITSEIELRKFHRAQRQLYLERLDQ